MYNTVVRNLSSCADPCVCMYVYIYVSCIKGEEGARVHGRPPVLLNWIVLYLHHSYFIFFVSLATTVKVIEGGNNKKQKPAYGADVLRLWVSSVDYSGDVCVGDHIIKQVPSRGAVTAVAKGMPRHACCSLVLVLVAVAVVVRCSCGCCCHSGSVV